MPKAATQSDYSEVVARPTTGFDLGSMVGRAVDDIPDHDPLLAVGTWDFLTVTYKIKEVDTKNGPLTKVVFSALPEAPVEVEEPNENFADLRQFVEYPMGRASDFQAIKRFVVAHGIDATTPIVDRAEDGSFTYPAFEAIRGNMVRATVTEGTVSWGQRKGQPETKLSNWRVAA